MTITITTKHTPGPWAAGPWVDSLGGHVYRIISGAGRSVSAVSVYGKRPDGSVGGRALQHGGHTPSVSAQECEANATLIAAAPDMLAALRSAADTIEQLIKLNRIPANSGTLREINAAVAKAESRS